MKSSMKLSKIRCMRKRVLNKGQLHLMIVMVLMVAMSISMKILDMMILGRILVTMRDNSYPKVKKK